MEDSPFLNQRLPRANLGPIKSGLGVKHPLSVGRKYHFRHNFYQIAAFNAVKVDHGVRSKTFLGAFCEIGKLAKRSKVGQNGALPHKGNIS